METLRIKTKVVSFTALAFLIIPIHSFAQMENMMNQDGMCPMCGAMGWRGIILGGLLIISAIFALIALTVFLVRRSRTHSH